MNSYTSSAQWQELSASVIAHLRAAHAGRVQGGTLGEQAMRHGIAEARRCLRETERLPVPSRGQR